MTPRDDMRRYAIYERVREQLDIDPVRSKALYVAARIGVGDFDSESDIADALICFVAMCLAVYSDEVTTRILESMPSNGR